MPGRLDLAAAATLAVTLPILLPQVAPSTGTVAALRVLGAGLVMWALGYLLLMSVQPGGSKAFHAGVAVGVGPALVLLVALSTTFVPGGFVARNILLALVLAGILLSGIAWRRHSVVEPNPEAPRKAVEPSPP